MKEILFLTRNMDMEPFTGAMVESILENGEMGNSMELGNIQHPMDNKEKVNG